MDQWVESSTFPQKWKDTTSRSNDVIKFLLLMEIIILKVYTYYSNNQYLSLTESSLTLQVLFSIFHHPHFHTQCTYLDHTDVLHSSVSWDYYSHSLGLHKFGQCKLDIRLVDPCAFYSHALISAFCPYSYLSKRGIWRCFCLQFCIQIRLSLLLLFDVLGFCLLNGLSHLLLMMTAFTFLDVSIQFIHCNLLSTLASKICLIHDVYWYMRF